MSEIVSIELLLDAETEAAVRAEWEALAAAGLSSMAAHTAESNRPHITLIARTSEVRDDVGGITGMLPLAVTLGAPVLFGEGDRRVLARSVVPTAELLEVHARAHALAGEGDDGAHTLPGQWMPHVTLARRMRTESLAQALALLGGSRDGELAAARRWDAATRTVTDLR